MPSPMNRITFLAAPLLMAALTASLRSASSAAVRVVSQAAAAKMLGTLSARIHLWSVIWRSSETPTPPVIHGCVSSVTALMKRLEPAVEVREAPAISTRLRVVHTTDARCPLRQPRVLHLEGDDQLMMFGID